VAEALKKRSPVPDGMDASGTGLFLVEGQPSSIGVARFRDGGLSGDSFSR
jgi:hypothetical protein